MARSKGMYILRDFIANCRVAFQEDFIKLLSNWPYMEVPVSLPSLSHQVLTLFLMIYNQVDKIRYLIDLICICVMRSYFFVSDHWYFFVKCLLMSFALLKIVFIFWFLVFKSFLYNKAIYTLV